MPLLPAGISRFYERTKRFEDVVRSFAKVKEEPALRKLERALRQRMQKEGTPIVIGDEAWFFFESPEIGEPVHLIGDWNGWQPAADEMARLNPRSSFFYIRKKFAYDARFAYRFAVGDMASINDPTNPNLEREVFGENTVVRMPGYQKPQYSDPASAKVTRGKLREMLVTSADRDVSGRKVTIYVPVSARRMRDLPVLYVHDGDEALHVAHFRDVLDNLYHFEPHLQPCLVVFVPPVDRHGEYMMNLKFAKWFANELVVQVEEKMKVQATGAKRGVMGSSLGGLCAAYQGLVTVKTFGAIVAQSPSFWVEQDAMVKLYEKTKRFPLRWYLHTGRVKDAERESRRMLEVLHEKGYDVTYRETEESHNWTNWKGKYAEVIRWFVKASV